MVLLTLLLKEEWTGRTLGFRLAVTCPSVEFFLTYFVTMQEQGILDALGCVATTNGDWPAATATLIVASSTSLMAFKVATLAFLLLALRIFLALDFEIFRTTSSV